MSQEMQVQITRGYHFALIMVTEFRSLTIPSAGKNVLLLGEEGVEVGTPCYWQPGPMWNSAVVPVSAELHCKACPIETNTQGRKIPVRACSGSVWYVQKRPVT